MKCPKCESEQSVNFDYYGSDLHWCAACGINFSGWQQSEIEALKKEVEMYEAMKEGFTERIKDKEAEIERLKKELAKRDYHRQRLDFAYGNTVMSNPRITKQDVALADAERELSTAQGSLQDAEAVLEVYASELTFACCYYDKPHSGCPGTQLAKSYFQKHPAKEPGIINKPRPKIVCLCGSTKFKDAFDEANYLETMDGKIVLSVGFMMHASGNKHGESIGATPEQKIKLDELHKRKIDLADEVLILNVGGYIGESTRSELEYAIAQEKVVRYLEGPERS